MEAFFAWLRDHGAEWQVDVGPSPTDLHGRGLIPRRNDCSVIEGGTCLVRVPRSLVLGRSTVLESPLGPLLGKVTKDLPDSDAEGALLVLYLMHERLNSHSFWKPFLDVQPASFSTPLYFNESELSELDGTPLRPMVDQVLAELKELFMDLVVNGVCKMDPVHFPQETCTWQLFLWAFSILNSRAFQSKFLAEELNARPGSAIIVPLADMANHRTNPNAKIAGVEPGAEEFKVIAKGEGSLDLPDEWCICYGEVPNWNLLLNYGFALSDNEFDSIDLVLDPPDHGMNDGDAAIRKAIFLELFPDLVSTNHSLKMPNEDGDDGVRELIQSARLLLGEDADIQPLTRANFAQRISAPLSQENEKRCRETLLGLLLSMSMPDIMHASVNEQRDPALSANSVTARIYKHNQNKIIQHAAGRVRSMLTLDEEP